LPDKSGGNKMNVKSALTTPLGYRALSMAMKYAPRTTNVVANKIGSVMTGKAGSTICNLVLGREYRLGGAREQVASRLDAAAIEQYGPNLTFVTTRNRGADNASRKGYISLFYPLYSITPTDEIPATSMLDDKPLEASPRAHRNRAGFIDYIELERNIVGPRIIMDLLLQKLGLRPKN
jgi:hypothetical protein